MSSSNGVVPISNDPRQVIFIPQYTGAVTFAPMMFIGIDASDNGGLCFDKPTLADHPLIFMTSLMLLCYGR